MLWFERLSSRLGLPFLAGAIVLGYPPILAVTLAEYFLLSKWGDYFSLITNPLSDFFLVTFCLLGARFAIKRIERLRQYAETMCEEDPHIELRSLYSFRRPLLVWPLVAVIIGLAFSASYPQTPTYLFLLVDNLPFYYFDLIFVTFLWTWGYSMYIIYRMGKLPLKLRRFSEDRTLGLKPFASASLTITGIYLLLVTTAIVFTVIGGFATLEILLPFAILLLLGPVFFALPLLTLRRQLLKAKQDFSTTISSRYTRVLDRLDASGEKDIDERLVGELMAIDKIQHDVHQIRGWPFDTAILVRLSAIILSVVAIILSRAIASALGI